MSPPFPSTSWRRGLVKILGSAHFLHTRVGVLVTWVLLTWAVTTLSVALSARIWPEANDSTFDPPTNPRVIRSGSTLTFIGSVPWIGRDRAGSVQRSIGDPIPESLTPPFVHYGSQVVTLSGPQGRRTALPEDLERDTRRGLLLGHATALLAEAGLMGFASRILAKARGPALTGPLIARFLAASFIPAAILGCVAGVLMPSFPFALEGAFAAILAANLLCLVLDPCWGIRKLEPRS